MNNKKGFSLTEVLVATIVMSMIMGSVLAFVQYSGEIWQRGNEKISAQNYNRMAFELIKQDLLQATSVTLPSGPNKSAKKIIYTINGQQYKISLEDYGELGADGQKKTSTLIRTSIKPPSAGSTSFEGDLNYTGLMRLARNVNFFYVKRLTRKTFEISIQIRKEQSEDELEFEDGKPVYDIISSESMVLIAPGI